MEDGDKSPDVFIRERNGSHYFQENLAKALLHS